MQLTQNMRDVILLHSNEQELCGHVVRLRD